MRLPRLLVTAALSLAPALALAQGAAPTVPVPNRSANDNSAAPANTRYVDSAAQVLLNAIATKAPIANPVFSGTVTAPSAVIPGSLAAGTLAGDGSAGLTAKANGAQAAQTLGGWVSALLFGTPTVATLRDFRTIFIAPGSIVYAAGYTTAGDGGGGFWRWSNTATDADDAVLTLAPTGSSGAGRWQRITNGELPVEATGARCDGGSDDIAHLRRGLAALGRLPRGGVLQIGAKACILSDLLDVQYSNVWIRGVGAVASALIANFPAGDVIRFGSAATQYSNFTISDLALVASVTRTSGAWISDYNGVNFTARNLRLNGGYDGILVDNKSAPVGQSQARIENIIAEDLGGECISLGRNSKAPALFANGVYVLNSALVRCGTSMALYSASGVYMEGVESYQAKNNAFVFAPTTAHLGLQGVWVGKSLADSSTAAGWYFGGDGKIAEVYLTASQASSSGSHGLVVAPGANVNGLLVTDMQSTANGGHGVRIAGGTNITIRGGNFFYNGTNGGGVGVAVEDGISGFSIQGIQAGHGGWAKLTGKPATQTHGVFIVGPANDNYLVRDNRFMGNTSGGTQFNDGGTGSNKSVGGNVAY